MKIKNNILFLVLIVLVSSGCQSTKSLKGTSWPLFSNAKSVDQIISGHPVVIDTRSPFEYNLAHPSGAINIQWEDYTKYVNAKVRRVERDYQSSAHRLALLGVSPSQKVVIVGGGKEGNASEGFVAYYLALLGVKEVYTLNYKLLKSVNPKESLPIKNKPYWAPQVEENKLMNIFEIADSNHSKNILEQNSNIKILTVDDDSKTQISLLLKYSNRTSKIPWKNFINKNGMFDSSIISQLEKHNIFKSNPILVISNQITESAYVTYLLNQNGFNAQLVEL